jgi:coenzyme F420-reducing hydrogenase delta subunit
MDTTEHERPKILILATLSGGYVGADGVGQLHVDYAPNTYILPVVCPSMFPVDFYIRSFAKGMDAIIVMYSGSDCPYKDGAQKTADLVNRTYSRMKDLVLDTRRLRLTAICTVCTTPFQREVQKMAQILEEIGPIERPIAIELVPA